MKTLDYRFNNEDDFLVFVELLKDCLVNLRQFVLDSDIHQAWLVLEVIDEVFRSKVLAKILSEPEEYKIRLRKSEVLAIHIMLTQYDILTGNNSHTMATLVTLQTAIDQYLTNHPPKQEQKCVQLLNSATSASKPLIDG